MKAFVLLDSILNPRLHSVYYSIRETVFSKELGWSLPPPTPMPVNPPTSSHGLAFFSVLYVEAGKPIGAVRGVGLSEEFPHKALFLTHVGHPSFIKATDFLCSLNGLAVLPEFRTKQFYLSTTGWRGSGGELLVLSQLAHFQAKGFVGAILTAAGLKAAGFFARLGFIAINPPASTGLHRLPMINMALAFDSSIYRNKLIESGITCRALQASAVAEAFCSYLIKVECRLG